MKKGYQMIGGLAALAALGFAGKEDYVIQKKLDQALANEASMRVTYNAQEQRLAEWFAKQGSPVPTKMAQAVVKQKRPRLMAAVAAVESNGDPTAKGKQKEKGAWQIIEREWGHVPPSHRPDLQADQASKVLEQLIAENNGNFKKALSAYNGDRSGKYARKVLAKLEGVPR